MKGPLVTAVIVCAICLMGVPNGGVYICGAATPEQRVRFDLEALSCAVQSHFRLHGTAPTTWAELKEPNIGVDVQRDWIDPWGEPYFVQVSFSGTYVRIGTRGRDRKLGGTGIDSDRSIEFDLGRSGFLFQGPDKDVRVLK